MRKIILLSVYFFTYSVCNAQSTFQRIYWTGGSNGSAGRDIKTTIDGGYVILGEGGGGWCSTSTTIFKINSVGTIIWQTEICVGGAPSSAGTSLERTNDGGYVISGNVNTLFNENFFLLKINGNGNLTWLKVFGGSNMDYCQSVKQTPDGGYAAVGYTNSFGVGMEDAFLIKTDSSGNLQWSKTYGGSSIDRAYSLQVTDDGGFIIVGETVSFGIGGISDVYLIRTNGFGDTLWTRTFGGSDIDSGRDVQKASNGDIVVLASTLSFGSIGDIYLLKIDSSGTLIWSKTIGIPGASAEEPSSLEIANDGGFIIAGDSTGPTTPNVDAILMKTDSSGTPVWSKIYAAPGRQRLLSAGQAIDNGYIAVGSNLNITLDTSLCPLIKTDSSGYSGCNEEDYPVLSATPPTLTGYTTTMVTMPNIPSIAHVDHVTSFFHFTDILCMSIVSVNPTLKESFSLFPNPATNEFKIQNSELEIKAIEIYSSLGERVFSQQEINNQQPVSISVADFPSDIYFITVTDQAGNKVTKKLVKM